MINEVCFILCAGEGLSRNVAVAEGGREDIHNEWPCISLQRKLYN